MSWSALALVTDAELGQLEPEATAAGAPWGAVQWPSARAEAKRTLKIWLEADFPDVVGVADRVVDTWRPDHVFGYTGGVYSDLLTAAGDDEENDVALATVLATFGTDRLYIGAAWEFEGLAVRMKESLSAAASVLTAKYRGPTGWVTLNATDGTAVSGATFARSGRITWTLPVNWQRERLNGTGDEYYWIELSISAALTAGTKASQLLPVRAPDALRRIAACLALHHIFAGLVPQAAQPETWQKKADDYLSDAKDLYGRIKASAALWMDLNRTNTLVQEERVTRPVRIGRA